MSVLVFGLASLALGGVDPTPFHQLINKLDSVENVLDASDDQLKDILSWPPDPIKPNALVGKLNAMADKLAWQNDRLTGVILAFLGQPPDPYHEEKFFDALGKVGDKAASMAERASIPPDPVTPEVEEALNAVESAALEIVNAVYGSIPLPS
jgi:hypothetical protein